MPYSFSLEGLSAGKLDFNISISRCFFYGFRFHLIWVYRNQDEKFIETGENRNMNARNRLFQLKNRSRQSQNLPEKTGLKTLLDFSM